MVYLLLDDSPEVIAEMPVQCVPIDRFVNGSICQLDIPDDRDEQKGLQSAVSPLPLTVCHILDQFHTGEDRQEQTAGSTWKKKIQLLAMQSRPQAVG